jgi:hypothetical protein
MALARHNARVADAGEVRMGSPRYGRLILDGKEFLTRAVEDRSLVWTDDYRLLAIQELVSFGSGPVTRVVAIDADRRTILAASESREGLCSPTRFEDDVLVYRHWQYRRGERERRLPLDDA